MFRVVWMFRVEGFEEDEHLVGGPEEGSYSRLIDFCITQL